MNKVYTFHKLTSLSLLVASCACALSQSAMAQMIQHIPTVRFSNISYDRCQNAKSGYFDIFYFNSEAPLGARVFLKTGFEVGQFDRYSNQYLPWYSWHGMKFIEMTQWEEFGWYARIPKALYVNSTSNKVTGINLKVDIKTASGEVIENDTVSDLNRNSYIKGTLPDLKRCQNVTQGQRKSCAVDLEIISDEQL